ncbi:MAG: hypothetical protein ACREU3_08580 [Steroidobacteraceae bacterium]
MPGAAPARAAAIEAAAALLTIAMHESHAPVNGMGSALERMAQTLARCARALGRERALDAQRRAGADAGGGSEPPDSPLAALEACQAALERDIALCIESLQFHDRLIQRLAQVANHLAGVTDGEHPACELRRVNLSEGSIELF